MGFPGDSASKESTCSAKDLGSIPGLGRCAGEGNGSPLQYSGLENSMDHGESGLASNHFLVCTPQLDRSEMFTELYREEKEAGDRGGQKDKRGK